jgi:hypothetical protein
MGNLNELKAAALHAQLVRVNAEIKVRRSYILNTVFQLECEVLRAVSKELEAAYKECMITAAT